MRVLFIYGDDWQLSDLLYWLREFTIHNGCYPDVIEMPITAFNNYQSLLKFEERKKEFLEEVYFRGIIVKKV